MYKNTCITCYNLFIHLSEKDSLFPGMLTIRCREERFEELPKVFSYQIPRKLYFLSEENKECGNYLAVSWSE